MKNNDLTPLQYQNALIDSIFTNEDTVLLSDKAKRIYRSNLIHTAHRALSISYPIFESMVGEQVTLTLAIRLLAQEKPRHGDWAQWGSSLSLLVANSELNDAHPYLTDVIDVEWKLHTGFRKARRPFDRDSFSALAKDDLGNVFIKLQDGVSIIQSPYALDSFRRMQTDTTYEPQKDTLLAPQGFYYFVIYQDEMGLMRVERTSEATYLWLHDIQKSHSLEYLLDKYPSFDMPSWLQEAIQKHWLVSLIS